MTQNPEVPRDLSPLKRAYLALNEMQAKLDAIEQTQSEPIAIIGMGCHFPGGVNDPDAFWQLLRDGGDAITEVPAERWDIEAYYDPDSETPGKMSSRWGGFLEQVDQFDAAFFGIAPREAMYMDPQQRLLLEVAWEALERAGHTTEQLAGSQTGVFIGICSSDYPLVQSFDPVNIDFYKSTGAANTILANRLSYLLDLRGPSVVLDTACSSSLVALHLACQSLRLGECSLALAGGVNAILSPLTTISLSKARMLATDGRCKTFDSLADGFVRGEGCGVVVLKRLSQAQADGDPILALVRGSAVNQDGHSNGLTAPNMQAQQAVIRQALKQARIPGEQLGYIETHGTGTPLGDPIEIEALTSVYGHSRSDGSHCALGAVKTNIGHLEGAAGIAGLIKTVLALQAGQVPPNLHFSHLNPNIDLEQTPFILPTALTPWPVSAPSRYAAVSSFGFGGTNAHAILESAPQVAEPHASSTLAAQQYQVHLLPISARSKEALTALVQAFAQQLEHSSDETFIDICFSACQHRSHHQHRLVAVGHHRLEVLQHLRSFLAGDASPHLMSSPAAGAPAHPHPLVFVFPGQGGQWLGMGRDLLAHEPVFQHMLQQCQDAMRPFIDWSLLELLADPAPEHWLPIDVIQPVIFAVQVSLAALWRSWGIEPDVVIGHSMGEIAAAQVAGILPLQDACKVICRRSQLLKRISGQGAMLLLERSFEEAQQLIAPWTQVISVAVSNSPRSTVLSGDPLALQQVHELMTTQQIFCRWVKVDVASHSPQVDILRQPLLDALADLTSHPGLLPMVSTVTVQPISGEQLTASYWVENLRQPVRFAQTVEQLLAQGYSTFVELSPHPTLLPALEESLRAQKVPGVAVGSLRRQEEESLQMRLALGQLYVHGASPTWSALAPAGLLVPLPTYPWQRERFWHPEQKLLPMSSQAIGTEEREQQHDPLANWFYKVEWEQISIAQPSSPATDSADSWLIFADQLGIGQQIGAALALQHAEVIFVHQGETFTEIDAHQYRLPPTSQAFAQLFKHIWNNHHVNQHRILYLWGLLPSLHQDALTEEVEQHVEDSCVHLLGLIQALAHTGWRDMPRLWLLTQGAQSRFTTAHAESPETLDPRQSVMWGMGRTLAQEQPRWGCSLLDLPTTLTEQDLIQVAMVLTASSEETQYLIRDASTLVARLLPHPLAAPQPEHERSMATPLTQDGSYLLVGGLKGLGLTVAGWLVEQGVRHLALLGRSQPSPTTEELLAQWRQQGVQVLVLQADVASQPQMTAVLEQIRTQLPPLRGVLHSAAVLQDGTFLNLSPEQFSAVLAPKVAGAWNLHQLTRQDPLDFFLLFSSLASSFGSLAQGNYAGANSFLDGLASYRRQQGLPALSINWGPWAEVGLAAQQANRGQRMALQGLVNIMPQQGLAALERLLLHMDKVDQLGIFSLNLRQLRQTSAALARAPLFARLTTTMGQEEQSISQKPQLRQQLLALGEQKRRMELERHIREQIAQILGLAPAHIESHTPLQTLGMDSLMALEIRNRLENVFEVTLSATLVWSYPTIDTLTDHLASQMTLFQESQPDVTSLASAELTENISTTSDLETLSTDEIADLLTQKLANFRKNI